MAPPPQPERYSPLAVIALFLVVLSVLAALFVGFLVAPLAILAAFYVGFAASDRSERARGTSPVRPIAPAVDDRALLEPVEAQVPGERPARAVAVRRRQR